METDSKKVLYIGRIGLPDDAPSIRVYNNSCILHKLGYKVDILCLKRNDTDSTYSSYSDWLRYFFVSPPNTRKPSFLKKIGNLFEPIFNIKAKSQVKHQIQISNPSIVITYNDLLFSSVFLKRYCRRKGIKLISDVTEWYEKRPLQKNIANYLVPVLTDYRIRYIDRGIGNIIAISPYLKDYYLSQNCNVLFLPPVFEIIPPKNIEKHHYYKEHVINFIYAGSPGNKDILLPFIESVVKINSNGLKIRLDIFGITESYLSSFSGFAENPNEYGVIFHGKVKHSEIIPYLERADFGVLLRHELRYAKAGFSTKFAECMLYGVAMFANKVGGAESIIENKKDGIIIDDAAVPTIIDQLTKIYDMSEKDLLQLRKNAATKAAELFVSTNYDDKFLNFLNCLR